MLVNSSCTALLILSLNSKTACSKTDAHSHRLVWKRRVGLYATWTFLWFGFPAPASLIDWTDRQNSDKTYKATPMIESLRTTQIAFLIRSAFQVSEGCGGEVQRLFVQGKIVWNHLWEHRFSVPDLVSSLARVYVFLWRRPIISI